MKVFDILKKVGGLALNIACPQAAAILGEVNKLLPADKQLPADATGTQIEKVMESLPPDQRAAIMNRKYDVQIATMKAHSTDLATLAEVDKTGMSTRPKAALIAMWLLVFETVLLTLMICWATIEQANDTLKAIKDFWPILSVMLGTPASIVLQYFGKRTKDKELRYNLAAGQAPGIGMLAGAIKMFKGK